MKVDVKFSIDCGTLSKFESILKKQGLVMDTEIEKFMSNAYKEYVRRIQTENAGSNLNRIQDAFVTHKPHDRHKFHFCGEEFYSMGELVFSVIKKYVDENPHTSYEELKKVFPDRWIGNFPELICRPTDYSSGRIRILHLRSGEMIGITTQWKFTEDSFGLFFSGVNGTLDDKYKITFIN